jgi:hypothetical protein
LRKVEVLTVAKLALALPLGSIWKSLENSVDYVSFGKREGRIRKLGLYCLESEYKGTKGLGVWFKRFGVKLSFKVASEYTVCASVIDSELSPHCYCILGIHLSVDCRL